MTSNLRESYHTPVKEMPAAVDRAGEGELAPIKVPLVGFSQALERALALGG